MGTHFEDKYVHYSTVDDWLQLETIDCTDFCIEGYDYQQSSEYEEYDLLPTPYDFGIRVTD